jgi:hypothetical protein
MHRFAGLARRAGGIIVLAVSLAAGGCSDKPTKQDCETLLDQVVELEIGAAGTGKLSAEMKADLDKQRKQIEEYLGGRFVERCLNDTPVAVVKCGLKARTKADYAACDEQ